MLSCSMVPWNPTLKSISTGHSPVKALATWVTSAAEAALETPQAATIQSVVRSVTRSVVRSAIQGPFQKNRNKFSTWS